MRLKRFIADLKRDALIKANREWLEEKFYLVERHLAGVSSQKCSKKPVNAGV
jgi:hypothetical protein